MIWNRTDNTPITTESRVLVECKATGRTGLVDVRQQSPGMIRFGTTVYTVEYDEDGLTKFDREGREIHHVIDTAAEIF